MQLSVHLREVSLSCFFFEEDSGYGTRGLSEDIKLESFQSSRDKNIFLQLHVEGRKP
jgi:hypothetical protein